MTKIALYEDCYAFAQQTIGTKVLMKDAFMAHLATAIEDYGWSGCREPGQASIPLLNPGILYTLSAGVGRRTRNPEDYVIRVHRGYVSAFLKREKAGVITRARAIVYTTAAYASSPQVTPEKAASLLDNGFTHILLAVLSFAGPDPQLSPHRFVENLGGRNNEYIRLNAVQIKNEASSIAQYDREWCVVAD